MTVVRRAILIGSVSLWLLLAAPAARAATPISACGTVVKTPGSYVVTRNLTVTKGNPGPCITVKSSYVTIDLAGFTIDCSHVSQLGIQINECERGIAVHNGHVTGCLTGLASFTCSEVLVDGVSAISNGNDGIDVGFGSTVIGSISDDNPGRGFSLECPSSAIDDTALGNAFKDLDEPLGGGCAIFNTLHATGP